MSDNYIKLPPHKYGEYVKITAKQMNEDNKPFLIGKINYHMEQVIKLLKQLVKK